MGLEQRRCIWILEDESDCVFILERILSTEYKLRCFSMISALASAMQSDPQPDLLIADLYLPDGEFLKWLIANPGGAMAEVPFVVVSSMDDTATLRECFKHGARDYLTKPFGRAELTVKLERILVGASDDPRTKIQLDAFRRRARLFDAESLELTPREYQILLMLLAAPDFTASKKSMLSKVWSGVYVQSKTLDVHLVHLRQKLRSISLQVEFVPPGQYRLVYGGREVMLSDAAGSDAVDPVADSDEQCSQSHPKLAAGARQRQT